MRLINNYHTHTFRCGHAQGKDEEYVLKAIEAGIKKLGFSDHVPFKGVSQPGVRMEYDRLEEYISSINSLKEKYKDQIKIYVGFEAEYYSEDKKYYENLLKEVDYLICGQHFALDMNKKMIYSGFPKDDQVFVIDYTNRVIEAIESGLFKYIAHPDIILRSYTYRDSFIESQIHKICQASERCHVPLEINLEGIKRQVTNNILGQEKFYPYYFFWKIASEYKIDVIIGADVHIPGDFLADYDKYAFDIVKNYNLNLITDIDLD